MLYSGGKKHSDYPVISLHAMFVPHSPHAHQARLLFFYFFKTLPKTKDAFVCLFDAATLNQNAKKGSLQIFHNIWDCVIYPTTFYHLCIFGGRGRVKYMKHVLASFVYTIGRVYLACPCSFC